MASVVIIEKGFIPSEINSKSYSLTELNDLTSSAIITDVKPFFASMQETDYPELNVIKNEKTSIAIEILPFRVRFTTIGLLGANAGIPGIGLQIIGINNYIL